LPSPTVAVTEGTGDPGPPRGGRGESGPLPGSAALSARARQL